MIFKKNRLNKKLSLTAQYGVFVVDITYNDGLSEKSYKLGRVLYEGEFLFGVQFAWLRNGVICFSAVEDWLKFEKDYISEVTDFVELDDDQFHKELEYLEKNSLTSVYLEALPAM